MGEKQNTINDIINELKRLQIEHGNVEVFVCKNEEESIFWSAWPTYNEQKNTIEF